MLNITITDTTPANMLRAIKAACDELLGNSTQVLTVHGELQSTAVPLDEQAATHAGRANELSAAAIVESEQASRCLTALNASQPVGGVDIPDERDMTAAPDAAIQGHEELDSAGQPWNADLHSSSRAKISDGTWKKRRNRDPRDIASDPEGKLVVTAGEPLRAAPISPAPIPPVPPLPPADTMKRIFALITAQVCTLNDVLAAAAEHDIKDLGQNGLTGASAEVQLAVLRKLEGN